MTQVRVLLLTCLLLFVSSSECFEELVGGEIQFDGGLSLKAGQGFAADDDDDDVEDLMNDEILNDGDDDVDFIEHDCKTIKPLENIQNEPWFKSERKVPTTKMSSPLVKYNHAYGIVVAGDTHATDEAMLRACYLMRYLFADHEHMRRLAYRKGMYVLAEGGPAVCCPPRMANKQLSCSCSLQMMALGVMKNNQFPFRGIGAPAHESAHYFLNHILAELAQKNDQGEALLKLPDFVDDDKWSWQEVSAKGSAKCLEESKSNGPLFDFLWNSWSQDLSQTPPTANGKRSFSKCKWHHYFIYRGSQPYLLASGGGELRDQVRAALLNTNPNLHNLLKEVWPCNNEYIPVCKDGSFQFTASLYQKLKIGKADPNDPSKMICKDIDTREISEQKERVRPTSDVFDAGKEKASKKKCLKVARQAGLIPEAFKGKEGKYEIQEGDAEAKLADETEHAWYLQRCCAKTAKFKETL